MDLLRQYLLTFLIFLPVAGVIALIWVPPRAAKWTAFGVAIGTFVASVFLTFVFDRYPDSVYAYAPDGGVVQLVQRLNIFPRLHIQYLVGADGLNVPLIFLTTFIFIPTCLASWTIEHKRKLHFQFLLLIEAASLGAIVALDFVTFFVFVQICLVLIFLLIWLWAGPSARRAAVKFLICTLIGSLAMLCALIRIRLHSTSIQPGGTFDLIQLAGIGRAAGPWAHATFLLLMLSALLWMAAFPFHAWLPEIHQQAPASANMLISTVIQNIGAYFILRIAYPLFPDNARSLWLLIAALGVIAILYGALCAIAQSDLPRLIAYNSISQSGLILLGIAMSSRTSLNGALFIMIARGLSSATLLFISSAFFERARHHQLSRFGGLAWTVPAFTGFSIVAFLTAMGLPLLCGFVGQIMVLLGLFTSDHHSRLLTRVLAPLVCIGAVLTCAYILRAIQKIFFGPARPEYLDFSDLNGREVAVLIPITLAMIILGILPWFLFFTFTNRTVAALVLLAWK